MTARTGADNATWVHPFGTAAEGDWSVAITAQTPGWRHTSLRLAQIDPGATVRHDLAGEEAVVVPLVGGCAVEVFTGGQTWTAVLAGRASVFAGPSDVVYVPAGAHVQLRNDGRTPVRVAVCGARVDAPTGREPSHLAAVDVPVELRGAGRCSREVRNFGTPGVLDADQIIACEVITPAGGWSSYPPHKHDEHREGVEAELEEIYYFETQAVGDAEAAIAPTPRRLGRPDGRDPVGYQQIYGTADRPIDVLTEVSTGDVVLVPHGWHGPAMAAPDADLYYLNVMAGPGPERAWLICDDPAHAHVRQAWEHEEIDPRLPMGGQR